MDFKDPAVIMSTCSMISSVALAGYFYSKYNELAKEMSSLSEHLKSIIKHVGENDNKSHLNKLTESISQFNNLAKELKQDVHEMKESMSDHTELLSSHNSAISKIAEQMEKDGNKLDIKLHTLDKFGLSVGSDPHISRWGRDNIPMLNNYQPPMMMGGYGINRFQQHMGQYRPDNYPPHLQPPNLMSNAIPDQPRVRKPRTRLTDTDGQTNSTTDTKPTLDEQMRQIEGSMTKRR